jgi:hypothetical protein
MGKYKNIFLIVLLIVMFLGLRLWRLDERTNFSMDQGMSMLRAMEIWKNKEITLIGPPASPVVEGRNFFHGPLGYYTEAGLGIISNWEPVRISIILVGLSLISMYFLYWFAKAVFDKRTALVAIIIWTFVPFVIDFAHLIWNPNFLLLLTPVTMSCLVKAVKSKKTVWFGVAGLLFGLGLQYHFQMAMLIALTVGVLIYRKEKLINLLVMLTGITAGYAPLILFDLRNNFYNIKTIGTWLMTGGVKTTDLPVFYFLVLLPAGVVLMAKLLTKQKIVLLTTFILLAGYSIWGVMHETQAKGMPVNWNYRYLTKTENIILKEAGGKFNIVNLLSGDTEFWPLRFLLVRDNEAPETIENYKDIDELFVVATGEKEIMNSKVWELSAMGDKKIEDKWQINEKISLFKLKRF